MTDSRPLLPALSAVALLLALAAYCYLGLALRYYWDDFSKACNLQENGFLGAQVAYYLGKSGRFSSTFVHASLAALGPSTAPLFPASFILLSVGAWFWAVGCLRIFFASRHDLLLRLLFSGLLVFLLVDAAPNKLETVFWQTGGIVYLLPMLSIPVVVGLGATAPRPSTGSRQYRRYTLVAAATFLAGGTAEIFSAAQITALLLLLIASTLLRWLQGQAVRILPEPGFLLAGLLGSLLAFSIMALAPGNVARLEEAGNLLHWREILQRSRLDSFYFAKYSLLTWPAHWLATLFFGAYLGTRSVRRPESSANGLGLLALCLVFLPVLAFAVSTAAFATGYYGLGSSPPGRALVTPQVAVLYALFTLAFLLGRSLSGALRRAPKTVRTALAGTGLALALLLSILAPLSSLRQVAATAPTAFSYARFWDQRHHDIERLRDAGQTDLAVPGRPVARGLQGIQDSRWSAVDFLVERGILGAYWRGKARRYSGHTLRKQALLDISLETCFPGYYGLRAVRIDPSLPAVRPSDASRLTP